MTSTSDIKFTRAQIIERLKVLEAKLEAEGRYVSANTIWLAIEELQKGAK